MVQQSQNHPTSQTQTYFISSTENVLGQSRDGSHWYVGSKALVHVSHDDVYSIMIMLANGAFTVYVTSATTLAPEVVGNDDERNRLAYPVTLQLVEELPKPPSLATLPVGQVAYIDRQYAIVSNLTHRIVVYSESPLLVNATDGGRQNVKVWRDQYGHVWICGSTAKLLPTQDSIDGPPAEIDPAC